MGAMDGAAAGSGADFFSHPCPHPPAEATQGASASKTPEVGVAGDARGRGRRARALNQPTTALFFLLFQELERSIEEAIACPCVADLRDGPCGASFVAAFSCFLRAQAGPPDAGGAAAPACLPSFDALQACMAAHPDEFAEVGAAAAARKAAEREEAKRMG